MNNKIYKISNIVNNAINEAFDFNEINVETRISDDALAYINAPVIRYSMKDLNINDLFLGLYKRKLPFRKKIPICTVIDKIGPCWYYNIYDIHTCIAREPQGRNYLETSRNKDAIYINRDLIKDNELLKKYNYKLYVIDNPNSAVDTYISSAPYVFYDGNYKKLMQPISDLHPIILQLLTNLAKKIDVDILPQLWKDPQNYKDKIRGGFFVSPDNGIIIISYLINISNKDEVRVENGWMGSIELYPSRKNKCILNTVLYSGLVEYNITTADNAKNVKEEIFIKNRKINFNLLVLSSMGIGNRYISDEEDNIWGYNTSFIQTSTGDFVMPLGSNKVVRWLYPISNALKIYGIQPIFNNYNISDTFPKTPKNRPLNQWLNYCVLGLCQHLNEWQAIYYNPKKFAVFQRFPYAKFIISLDPKYIGQLCGPEIEAECKQRPILLEKGTFDISKAPNNTVHIVYACLWVDDEFIDEFKDFMDKKYTLNGYKEKLKKKAGR